MYRRPNIWCTMWKCQAHCHTRVSRRYTVSSQLLCRELRPVSELESGSFLDRITGTVMAGGCTAGTVMSGDSATLAKRSLSPSVTSRSSCSFLRYFLLKSNAEFVSVRMCDVFSNSLAFLSVSSLTLSSSTLSSLNSSVFLIDTVNLKTFSSSFSNFLLTFTILSQRSILFCRSFISASRSSSMVGSSPSPVGVLVFSLLGCSVTTPLSFSFSFSSSSWQVPFRYVSRR